MAITTESDLKYRLSVVDRADSANDHDAAHDMEDDILHEFIEYVATTKDTPTQVRRKAKIINKNLSESTGARWFS